MTRQGTELAVDAINKRGGVRSHRLTLVRVDDEGTGAKAAAVAQELVDADSVLAVVGHANSSATVAAARVYDGQLAAVSPSASSPEITGLSAWLFRVIPSDSANGHRAGAVRDDARPHARRDSLREQQLRPRARRFVPARVRAARSRRSSRSPSMARRSSRISRISKLHEPGLIFVAGSDGSGLEILREARRQGIKSDFLGGDGWAGVTSDTAAAEGVYVGAPFSADDPRPRGAASSCRRSARSSVAIRTASRRSRTTRRWSSHRRSSALVPIARPFATISRQCSESNAYQGRHRSDRVSADAAMSLERRWQ